MNYFQHGDVILKECEKPTNVEILKTNLLYQGMNHQHKVKGKFSIGKVNEKIYLHSKGCELYHDEHHSMNIPEGIYELSIVLEYDHLLEESRTIID